MADSALPFGRTALVEGIPFCFADKTLTGGADHLDISRSLLRQGNMDGYHASNPPRFAGAACVDPARIQLRIPNGRYDGTERTKQERQVSIPAAKSAPQRLSVPVKKLGIHSLRITMKDGERLPEQQLHQMGTHRLYMLREEFRKFGIENPFLPYVEGIFVPTEPGACTWDEQADYYHRWARTRNQQTWHSGPVERPDPVAKATAIASLGDGGWTLHHERDEVYETNNYDTRRYLGRMSAHLVSESEFGVRPLGRSSGSKESEIRAEARTPNALAIKLEKQDAERKLMPNPIAKMAAQNTLPATRLKAVRDPDWGYDGTRCHVDFDEVEGAPEYQVWVAAYPDGSGAQAMARLPKSGALVEGLRPAIPLHLWVTYTTKDKKQSRPSNRLQIELVDSFGQK